MAGYIIWQQMGMEYSLRKETIIRINIKRSLQSCKRLTKIRRVLSYWSIIFVIDENKKSFKNLLHLSLNNTLKRQKTMIYTNDFSATGSSYPNDNLVVRQFHW
jgi:hypothetical protein